MFSKSTKIIGTLLIMTLLSGLMIGCTSQETDGLPTGEPQVLRILGGWGDDSYVRNNWTDYYELTHKQVEIEIIPMQEPVRNPQEAEEAEPLMDRIKRLMTEDNPPDVILIDELSILSTLVEEGLVQSLDTFMEKSNFDLNALVPAVRAGIQDAGDGNSMYALAPTFSSQALFYNKNLFDQKGVPYPTDNMTWDQIAELARQLNSGEGEDRIYGFWSNEGQSIYYFLNNFTAPLELSMFDEEFKTVTFNTPLWESALTKYINYVNDGLFPQSPEMQGERYTPEMDMFWRAFYNGKAAMAVMHSYELQNMQQMSNNPDMMNFDWDVVTVPTHAEAPEVGGNLYMQGLMAINRNAQNVDLAWDFIQFHNGEDMLKLKSRQQGMFVSQEAFIQNNMENGPSNLQAFYALKPAPNPMYASYQNGGEKVYEVMAMAEQTLQEVIKGNKSVQEGLAELQSKGQEILDQKQE